MIRTEDQYNITKHWLREFETSVRLLNEYVDVEDPIYNVQVNSLNIQIELFKKELIEYKPIQS